jgi:hypothetical protein
VVFDLPRNRGMVESWKPSRICETIAWSWVLRWATLKFGLKRSCNEIVRLSHAY